MYTLKGRSFTAWAKLTSYDVTVLLQHKATGDVGYRNVLKLEVNPNSVALVRE
jgi:hypothetical protein